MPALIAGQPRIKIFIAPHPFEKNILPVVRFTAKIQLFQQVYGANITCVYHGSEPVFCKLRKKQGNDGTRCFKRKTLFLISGIKCHAEFSLSSFIKKMNSDVPYQPVVFLVCYGKLKPGVIAVERQRILLRI